MAIHMIDISPETLRWIGALVQQGRYENLEQFLSTAIRNQLVLENAETDQSNPEQPTPAGASVSGRHEPETRASADSIEPCSSWRAVEIQTEPLPTSRPVQKPLWGQFYRFLPLKLVLRLMVNTTEAGRVSLTDFATGVVGDTTYLAAQLRDADTQRKALGMIPLSVGFPNPKKPERSRHRFLVQYVGLLTKQGELTGFPADMGFALRADDTSADNIYVSRAGAEFAQLPNPVLDAGDLSVPLSPEEVGFLVDYIAAEMAGEKDQMVGILRFISEGADTPSALSERMLSVYEPYFGGGSPSSDRWTDKKVTLMRSGAVSRLVEFGFVRRQREGTRVRYSLAGDWEEALRILSRVT